MEHHSTTEELEERLAELRGIFLQQLPARIAEIHGYWHTLSHSWSDELLDQLLRASHSLAGTGGTFGATELSRTARALENHIKALQDQDSIPDTASKETVTTLLAELSTCAAELDANA